MRLDPTLTCPPGLVPYERALRAYFFDEYRDAEITLHDDTGQHEAMPVEAFFREPDRFFPFEEAALERCRGRVLELGAGTGSDALALQERGLEVTAVDVVPGAVEIMEARGVRQPRHADWRTLEGERADTLLMLMNGVGWTGSLEGLDAFLQRAHRLVSQGGQLVLDGGPMEGERTEADSMEWPPRSDPQEGDAWIRLEFEGEVGPPFQELYLGIETLSRHARRAGWLAQPVYEGEAGSFVARLVRV